MQSRADHGGWVDTEGVPPFLLFLWVGGAVVAVIVLGVAFGLDLLQPRLGFGGSVALVALVAVGDLAPDLFLTNLLRPKSIRPEPEGIEVRPMFGPVRRLRWTDTRILSPAGTAGFSTLQIGGGTGTPTSAFFLSPAQSMAIRSSPFRPTQWSESEPAPS
ncbi:MAG: hypothetical protein L3K16_05730 [Thermoplasmata archaeon]|nr:hypothetical protein [Thermoplasmata archaeon]